MSICTDLPTPSTVPPKGAVAAEFKTWMCVICGAVYSERDGWPDEGIAPGTRWADVPDEWVCPDCGFGKGSFEMTEV